MKQTIFWVSIMLVTFSLGVVTAFVWLYGRNSVNTKPETVAVAIDVTLNEMPILAYCELANNPDKYDGKVVRIGGRLVRGMHGIQLISPNCYAQEKKAAVVLNDQDWETLKEAEPDFFSNYEDKPVPFRRFEVIAVGKFSRTKPLPGAEHVLENSSLRFEILKLEKASKQ